MVSTYTSNLKYEKPAQGDYAGGWATPANNDYDLIDQSVAAITSVDCTGGSNITLTSFNGATDQARSAILVLKGTPSTQISVLVPNTLTKLYAVRSKVTNTQVLVVNNQAQVGVGCTIAPQEQFSMFTDGVRCRKLGVVPKNTLMFWLGNTSNIPAGWEIKTDFYGYFLKMNSYVDLEPVTNPTVTMVSAGNHNHTGLTGAHTLTTSELPSHTHTYQRNDTFQGVQSGTGEVVVAVGTSTYSSGSAGSGDGHTHTISTDGLHTHTVAVSGGEPGRAVVIPIRKYT